MAIHFLYDNLLEKQNIEIEDVLKELKKDPYSNKKLLILNSFTKALIEVSKKEKKIPEIKLKPSIIEIKKIQKPKPVPLKKLPTPSPSIILAPKPTILQPPKPSNVIIKEPQVVKQEQLEYKTSLMPETKIKEEKPKINIKKIETEKTKKIPLVVDKDNNEVIAFAEINGSYNITEPPLNDIELKVLQDTKKEISGNPKKYIEQKENKLINYVKKYSSKNKI